MTKKTLLSAFLLLTIALILVAAAGCARPKPEAKLTPTVSLKAIGTTGTPAASASAVVPTVVTTKLTVVATQTPGPASTDTAGAAAAGTPGATDESSEYFVYTIQWGDTLYSLASKYNTSVEAISALNGINRPDSISTGMQIKIPKAGAQAQPTQKGAQEYTVQAGDDLGAIAKKFGVTTDEIVKANNLKDGNFIFIGQKLTIPAAGAAAGGAAPAATSGAGGTAGAKSHTVKAGETLDMIARQYGVTREALMAANKLTNPNLLQVGQVLQIP